MWNFNGSNIEGSLPGSFPLLNKNTHIWSILAIRLMGQIFCRLISQRFLLFHLLVAHIVNLSAADCYFHHAVTLPYLANGLTVSQPVTAWEAGNAESKAAPHFISRTIILAAFKGKI